MYVVIPVLCGRNTMHADINNGDTFIHTYTLSWQGYIISYIISYII